ncbi:MAG TPA: dipeptidase PepE [Arachidicoccus sp.]|nr:dipeptidase PepE [Arachidicoccus sp.]
MLNVMLASTSTLFGSKYLQYIRPEIEQLFKQADQIIFIPFARPGGISHEDYTRQAAGFFEQLNITVHSIADFEDPSTAIKSAKGFFTGGGNTFLLVKELHERGLIGPLQSAVADGGIPYLGTSAGANIGGLTMQTTNDMPIVYPSSFRTLGLVPFNINPHFLDQQLLPTHMGETRETRIAEFHTQNSIPVVGLPEGSWIRGLGDKITVEGTAGAKIFEQGKAPYHISAGNALAFGTTS